MFVRPSWRPASPQDAVGVIEKNPWALLVSNGTDGPVATNLPLIFDGTCPDKKVLLGHIARANSHFDLLREGKGNALAIFEGPWSYVTASWYPNRDMPSTYYYTAVHCYGRVYLQSEEELDASLEELTRTMETPIPGGWSTREIPRSEITRRFSAIQGFAFHIDRLEAKFKLGQDEPLRDALAIAEKLESSNRELSNLIRTQNAGREG